ncbi:MAG: methyltransferase domain-containing protein, partial [Bryobacteraceae bacterium]
MRTETSAAWLQELCCPACKAQLRSEDGDVVCLGCGESWPVRDGIPYFVPSFPYWGEIPQETMTEVLRQCTESWRDALLTSEDPVVKSASDMILNLDRANWSLLADLAPQSRVLDIGAGMGANSHSLALRYGEVFAVEPVTERVRFMRQRFEQEGIRNIQIIQTSLWDLPFPDGSFDLIVMNGVLEWVATGRQGNPRRLQETALKAAARLLRPGGVLYVGIENRFTAGYF